MERAGEEGGRDDDRSPVGDMERMSERTFSRVSGKIFKMKIQYERYIFKKQTVKKNKALFIFLTIYAVAHAQPDANFQNDKNTFIEKSIEYDKWLKSSGLGKVLRVETVRVADTLLSLDLGFYTSNGDSVTVLWNALKADFAKQDRGVSLEEELFYKMVYFMEIRPEQGYVQLFNSYDTRKDLYVCFRRSIKYENHKVFTDSAGCKTVLRDFTVEPIDFSNLRSVKKAEFAKRYSKEAVFQKIINYAEKRFKQQNCENRKPRIDWTNTNEELLFTVTDLCKEVLPDEPNPWWCKVLTPICKTCQNCAKREAVGMRIRYFETPAGYRIFLDVDAKFGSGWYNEVARGAYKNMEVDYKSFVDKYADRFKDNLLTELKKQP